MKYKIEKNTVQETLLIPLYGRKMCSRLYPSLYRDETAIQLIDQLDYDFSVLEKKSGSLMQRFGFLECAMRRSYLKEHRPIFYTNLLTNGTLHRHLAEIDQACNERMEIIVSAMVKQEGVTEALKAADQMEWVRRMNSIRSRAEEIVLTELVYE